MDRLRAAFDELVDKVRGVMESEPKSPVEILLDQYLSLDGDTVTFSPRNCTAVAVPTNAMNDFASRTRNVVDYPLIMERIWEILIEYQHDPALMKKALNLMHYLLINGSIQVLKDCQEDVRASFLQALASDYNRVEFEQYQFSKNMDVGAGVRKVASEIDHLITNERELFFARRNAEKLHASLSDRGLRTAYPSPHASGSEDGSALPVSSHASWRPPVYTDYCPAKSPAHDDLANKMVTHPNEIFDEDFQDLVSIDSNPEEYRVVTQNNTRNDPKKCVTSQNKCNQQDSCPIRNSTSSNDVDLLDSIALDGKSGSRPASPAPSARLPEKLVAII